MPVIIRPALAADIKRHEDNGVRGLYNRVKRNERKHGRSPLAPPSYDKWQKMMHDERQGNPYYQAMVAEDQQGKIVGFCMANHNRMASRPFTTVLKLLVDPAFQKQGLASKMMSQVFERAESLGKPEIHVKAEAGAGKAAAFYEHLGFCVMQKDQTQGSIPTCFLSYKL